MEIDAVPEAGERARERETGERTGITGPSRRGSSQRFLTDVIVEMGLVSRRQVEEAIETSRGTGTMPERVLLDSGALTQDGLTRALAERYGLDHLDLGVFSVDMSAANLVSTPAAKRYQAVPVAFTDKRTLLVAMADPSNVLAVDDIAIMTGYEVRVAVAPPEDIANLISRLDRLEDVVSEQDGHIEELEQSAEVVDLRETADDAPVVKLVNQIVAQAVEQGASDVHLAPDGRELRVRFRVDGVLHDVTTVPRRMAAGRGLAREDHGRDEHRRAAPAAGRPCRADRRRASHRPARRDAAERSRGGGRDARPRQGGGRDQARQARLLRVRPRPLRARLPRDARGGAGDGPDGLGQVDDPVCGAAAAEHPGEEHHHRRGPGRVRNGGPHAAAGLRQRSV